MVRSVLILPALLLACALAAGSEDTQALSGGMQRLLTLSDAAAVVHPGMLAPATASRKEAFVAVWIDSALKGRLQSGRDIVWIPGGEWPKAQAATSPGWLVFFRQDAAGAWHVLTNGSTPGIVPVRGLADPLVASIVKFQGGAGPGGAVTEPPVAGEIQQWIKEASKLSEARRTEAFERLIAAGENARPDLINVQNSGNRDAAAVARTLLPLMNGGPVVNGLRLALGPARVALKEGEAALVTVTLANVTHRDIKAVTGVSSRGDNFETSAAYEVVALDADLKPLPDSAALPTVLPKTFNALEQDGGRPLALVRVAPRCDLLPNPMQIRVQKAAAGAAGLRLVFPAGHIELPGPGTYGMRVRFDCPGPRPDQQHLLTENYWFGGQLVSNQIVLVVQ